MKVTLLSSLVLLLAAATTLSHPGKDFRREVDEDFIKFKKTYGRVYDDQESEMSRKAIFEQNYNEISQHNMEYSLGLKSYNLSINRYSDLTREEFHSKMGILSIPLNRNRSTFVSPVNVAELPKEVDWRKEGLVTPFRPQLYCGSCWAFSAVGAIEGQHARKTGELVELSAQQLVDCSRDILNSGCGGGYIDEAFMHVKEFGGLDTEKAYPYEGKDENGCRFRRDSVGATISGFVDLERGNERELRGAVGTVGPVSVYVDGSQSDFKQYSAGIYDNPQCNGRLSHAILIIGYGTENGQDYWLIKNSWDKDWGDGGFGKIARNKNMCGIALAASFPVV